MPVQSGGPVYFTFVAAVLFIYWAGYRARLPRLAVLLFANYLFCAQFGAFYALLIPICSSIDYAVGLGLMRFRSSAGRRILLGISLAVNLGLLIGSRHLGSAVGGDWKWVFPLGLSFYTFQSLTYAIDLYRRDGDGTRSLLSYLASASFFPTLQAGPITRVHEIVKQVETAVAPGRAEGGRAFFLIGMGLIKKALIADYLSENLVNRVFDTPTLYSGAEVLIGVYGYAIQLYYDFSGYTDIARGTGMLLGVKLPINFDRPYLSGNVTEFWRRWHLSFSNWLRDYLYFALPGARTKAMPYVNLVITMLLGGLWHGLSWTFAIWGLLHGLALAVVRWRQARRGRVRVQPGPVAVFGTFQFVCFTWIFFRASSLADARDVMGRIASMTVAIENISPLIGTTLLIGAGAFFVRKEWHARAMEAFAGAPFYVHATALAALAYAIQLAGGAGSAPFVYSRF
jgi:alginate O-acetyltransferase complex protein AlgI